MCRWHTDSMKVGSSSFRVKIFANRQYKVEKSNYQTGYILLILTVILLGRGRNLITVHFYPLDKLWRVQYNPKSYRKIILIQRHNHINGLQDSKVTIKKLETNIKNLASKVKRNKKMRTFETKLTSRPQMVAGSRTKTAWKRFLRI